MTDHWETMEPEQPMSTAEFAKVMTELASAPESSVTHVENPFGHNTEEAGSWWVLAPKSAVLWRDCDECDGRGCPDCARDDAVNAMSGPEMQSGHAPHRDCQR